MKSWETKVFYALLGVVAAVLAAVPFSPAVQRMIMAKFHWRGPSFAQWALLQFVPSMYNFSNEIWVTQDPVDVVTAADTPPASALLYQRVNHFPLRMITFRPEVRESFAQSGQHFNVVLRSRYRDTTLISVYEMDSYPPALIFKNVPNAP